MVEMTFKERVSLLLAGLEEGREVRAYLERFGEEREGCFAVIKVGGAVVEHDLEPLADALALLQFLGLPPVVIHGAGPQLDRDLARAGFEEERRDGLRVTPVGAMPIVAAAAGRGGLDLAGALRARGAHAVTAQGGLIEARAIDEGKYGLVGDVASVDGRSLEQLLAAGVIPLLGCAQADHRGQLLNVNADNLARAAALALEPRKIVFVTGTGGLLDAEGRRVDTINLAAEGERLFEEAWLAGGMRHKVREIAGLLEKLPPSASVSMTGAANMVRELFTHKGAGTLIRRGEKVLSGAPERARELENLIENAFGRRLRAGYWTGLDARLVLLSENLRAGAIVRSIDGVPLLDKFAVAADARGEGLAKTLWHKLRSEAGELIWRSRRENPFNGYYTAQADGFVRRGPWTVYWYGRGLEHRIAGLADTLASRPADFEEVSP